MTYQLQLASVPAPEADLDVFPFMNQLRQEAGEQPPSAMLKDFHDKLAALFPDTPWSEGHYAGHAGRLTLVRRTKVVVPHVLYLAAEMGLTVVDNQSGEVHRPPTYQVVLEGPDAGVELGDAAARLALLMRKPVTEMIALLSGGRRTVVKKGVPRFQANQYIAALRGRAGCRATLAPEPGPVARPKPPMPTPTVAPLAAPAAVEPNHAMPPLSRTAAKAEADARAAEDAKLAAIGTDAQLYDVAEGVRLVCCAIGLNFLLRGVILQMAPIPAGFCSLLLMLLTMYGCLRLTAGLGYGAVLRSLLMLLVLSPVIVGIALPFLKLPMKWLFISAGACFVATLVLGIIGTRRLKKAGYKVGLFGASKADVRYLGAMGDSDRLTSTTMAWLTFFIVVAAFMTGEMTSKPKTMELTGGDVPCDFVGTWEVEKDGGRHELRVADNGTYSGSLISGQAQGFSADYAGRWRYSSKSLIWTDDAYTPVRMSVNNVTSIGEREFTALDRRGMPVVFQLKRRGKSQRCNFN